MSARATCILILLLFTVAPAVAQTGAVPGLPAPPPSGIDPSTAAPRPGQRPELSAADRAKIFQAVQADKSKATRLTFPTQVGADVPPALELHSLPDEALIQVPITKMFKCVVVDGKVVLVDPTTMRVVEVIDR